MNVLLPRMCGRLLTVRTPQEEVALDDTEQGQHILLREGRHVASGGNRMRIKR